MTYSKIIKTQINLGTPNILLKSSRDVSNSDSCDVREISYKKNNIIEKFPLIYYPERIKECNEMNLFLIQRYTGEFALQKTIASTTQKIVWSPSYLAGLKGKRLDLKSVDNIAKDLRLFLDFLILHNIRYEEVIAAPLSDSSLRDKLDMPVWKYQEHLCDRLESNNDISFDYAQRLLRRVRDFYLWSYKRGTIGALPFKMDYKLVQKKKFDSVDVLLELPTMGQAKGFMTAVSDLSISEVYKKKSDTRDGLQPYNEKELASLLSSDIAKKEGTYSLFLKCAYLGGLRSFEMVQLDCQDVVNPEKDSNIFHYQVGFIRKGGIPKPINITSTLMQNLYKYTLSARWKERALKHETIYGKDNPKHPLPLFINSAGERMAETTASDTISYVRKEQKEKNQTVLDRTFHDLRSTFGTYLAIYLIKKFNNLERVRSTLMKWMGHADFKTTESYIGFAKALSNPSEYGAMHQWVIDVYVAVNEMEEGI